MNKFCIERVWFCKWMLAIVLTMPLLAKSQNKLPYVLDMVHNNPGESLTKTRYSDPTYLIAQGYTGQVMNDFTFVHAAITFDGFDKRIFPAGSKEREWVLKAAERVKLNIKKAHAAGIKVYYFTDIIVLPKKLVELYHDEICDDKGKISFERPKTIEIHREMLREVFNTFPDIDGLVIRTGETYLNNVPYHTGNNPITNGVQSHIKLINLLRDEVCIKRNKMVFYRTWSFGGMHDDPNYYLDVTNSITPHPNLVFSIKHTKGDYHRTFDFNPTLAIGKHPQIVEVECQREYEGKGAFPDYIADGVINGFEEYKANAPQKGNACLNDIKSKEQFKGIWTWSRGGGWVGPYITNEFWCKLNAWVISHWGQHPDKTEAQVFDSFMDENGIKGKSRQAFRQLCLLSAKAVLRGHESAVLPFNEKWVWWTRDEFLGGSEANSPINKEFKELYPKGLLPTAVSEKYEAVELWKQIVGLSREIQMPDKANEHYIKVSCQYGLLLHQIMATGWDIMALGYQGDQALKYDKDKLKALIHNYDTYWEQYHALKANNPDCATLYKPYGFVNKAPDYHGEAGMDASVNKYRGN
jgi:hypothetical protein